MFGFAKSFIAAASLFTLIAQPALAEHRIIPDNNSVQIDVSHVSLQSDRDWNRMADAIHDKAAEICERDTGASDRRAADVEECTQAAYDNAVQQMRDIYTRRVATSQTRLARS
ncbi:UrcA family protein [Asaia prunellae]|uniref:UrcA family protein n=1 Tax=Asaia prunellae TaxID=610245 RepID=UPI00046EAABF|nr:UrcA family protein [Asaia prunellae]